MHEHEFEEPTDVVADETLVIYQRCWYREILGAMHSERHDETFYDEGPRCEAVKTTYYEIESVHRVIDGGAGTDPLWRDHEPFEDAPIVVEDIIMGLENDINAQPYPGRDPPFDPREERLMFTTVHDGEVYQIIYEKCGTEIQH